MRPGMKMETTMPRPHHYHHHLMMISFARTAASRRGVAKLGDMVINTPAMVIPTTLFSIRHLTRDMFDQVLDPQQCVMEVYYEDILENWPVLQDLPMPFKTFVHLHGYAVWFALRESKYFVNTERLQYINSDDTVSCINHGGVCKLPLKVIKEMSQRLLPDALIAPVDHFELPASAKRIARSVVRTEKYRQHLHDLDTLIPSSIKQTPLSTNPPIVAISAVSKSDELPNMTDCGVYLRGLEIPFEEAIELMRAGRVDFIDVSHVLEKAEKGFALNLPTCNYDPQTVSFSWLDMNDLKYEADTTRLCEGCPCPGCQFMKSYIHHLFHVREMLGPAALTAHNLFQMRRFLSLL